ncbi:hypothetical protein [Cryobacterium sp. N22]|uniref:hypothetical protein n=1 Tax=Cryobacterium sp. N22 TaxID=2048290 RepID=UPI000CE4F489|nr:hypothetical protein [Cryobacterium sp. N22]
MTTQPDECDGHYIEEFDLSAGRTLEDEDHTDTGRLTAEFDGQDQNPPMWVLGNHQFRNDVETDSRQPSWSAVRVSFGLVMLLGPGNRRTLQAYGPLAIVSRGRSVALPRECAVNFSGVDADAAWATPAMYSMVIDAVVIKAVRAHGYVATNAGQKDTVERGIHSRTYLVRCACR